MKIARYFIRSILVVCLIVIVLTIVRVLTPKVDVFSSVTTEWTPHLSPNAVQQITCNFSRENFMQEILQVKPTANYQDVLDFAESMQVNAEITDSSITQYDDGKVFRIEYRAYITHYDRLLKRKLGIMFYSNSLQDYMSMWI